MSTLGDRPESWPVADSVDLHRDDWIVALRADWIRRPGHPDEEPFRRVVMEHPGAVVILAIDAEDRVFCIQQYRHPAERSFVELPAGLCDVPGEDPLEVARRELREEGGLAATEWEHLISTYSSPGISAEVIHSYVAHGLSEVDRGDFLLQHEEAELVPLWVPFDELVAAVLDGRVQDAPVVVAVLTHAARQGRTWPR